jgi:hypothetical protein
LLKRGAQAETPRVVGKELNDGTRSNAHQRTHRHGTARGRRVTRCVNAGDAARLYDITADDFELMASGQNARAGAALSVAIGFLAVRSPLVTLKRL